MENKNSLYVLGFLILLGIAGGIYISKTGTNQAFSTSSAEATMEPVVQGESTGSVETKMDDKLIIVDEKVGTGAEALLGTQITVNYLGTFTDGTKFDSSYDPGRTPFTFTLGSGNVIQGWEQGFTGMKVGGKRKLTVPPSLGYGPNDYQSIPGNSTLIFEVELLKVE